MDLARRDKIIDNMQLELEYRKADMFNKIKQLKIAAKDNKRLKNVVKEYTSYHNNIKNQKIQEYRGLENLLNYINIISNDDNISNEVLCKTKDDQRGLLREMDNIKREIDKLTSK